MDIIQRTNTSGSNSQSKSGGSRQSCVDDVESKRRPSSNKSSSDLARKLRVWASLYPIRLGFVMLMVVLFVVVCLVPPSSNQIDAMTSFINTSASNSGTSGATGTSSSTTDHSSQQSTRSSSLSLWRQYENCTVRWDPKTKQDRSEWSTKPLWFPGHPNSVEDNTVKEIVKQLLPSVQGGAPAKSYYASSKAVKRCFGKTESAACIVVYPIVDMSPGPAEKIDQYEKQFVMVLRNPLTVIPSHFNFKGIKYHGLNGQTPIEDWRKVRDELHAEGTLLNSWKFMLSKWKSIPELTVGLYLTHERVMDAHQGPQLLSNLAKLFSQSGFPDDVPPQEEMACLWYQALGKSRLQDFELNGGYDYKGYIPGFTKAQKESMIQELTQLQQEYSSDSELVTILKEYIAQIEASPNDVEWKNETAA